MKNKNRRKRRRTHDSDSPIQKKNSINKLRISIIAAACVLFIVAVVTVYNLLQPPYILKYDGEKVGIEEYKLFLIMYDGEQSTALDMLVDRLVTTRVAQEKGYSLSDDGREYLRETVVNFMNFIEESGEYKVPDLTEDRLVDLFAILEMYNEMMYAETEGLIDEDVYLFDFESYKLEGKYDYIGTTFKYIVTETYEGAEEAAERIRAGVDVDEIIKDTSIVYDEEYGIDTITLADYSFTSDSIDILADLDQGQASPVIDLDGAYGIFIPQTIIIPTEQELAESFRAMYTAQMFDGILDSWVAQAQVKIKINQKVADTISLDDIRV